MQPKQAVARLRKTVASIESRCMELRMRGHNADYISKELGVTVSKVNSAITRRLCKEETYWLDVEKQRKVDAQVLDDLQVAWYGQAIGDEVRIVSMGGQEVPVRTPNIEAAKLLLSIQERRAKLMGLDAPKQIEAKVSNTHGIDEQLRELVMGSGKRPRPTCEVSPALDAPGSVVTIDATGELV